MRKAVVVVLAMAAVSAGVFFVFINKQPAPKNENSKTTATGISGTIKYTGNKRGGIVVVASTELNSAPIGETAKMFSDASGGDFTWNLSAGSYYATAFRTINRPAEPGGPRSNEPIIHCGPIDVEDNKVIIIELGINDTDTGTGDPKPCPTKSL